MVTNDERREMARKIRELPNSAAWTADRIGEALLNLLVYGDGRESLNLLADLIDPSDTSQGCRDTVACDRDALLALADELERPMRDGGYSKRIARRIREACGEVPDAGARDLRRPGQEE